jgi:outer membrane protein assembly factor BamB
VNGLRSTDGRSAVRSPRLRPDLAVLGLVIMLGILLGGCTRQGAAGRSGAAVAPGSANSQGSPAASSATPDGTASSPGADSAKVVPGSRTLPSGAGIEGEAGAWRRVDVAPPVLEGAKTNLLDTGGRLFGIDADAGSIYAMGMNGDAIAIDRVTGKLRWKAGGQGVGEGSPVLLRTGTGTGDLAFIARRSDGLAAYDALSGTVLWEHPLSRTNPAAGRAPVGKRPLAVVDAVASGRRFVALWNDDGKLEVIDASSGLTCGSADLGSGGFSLAAMGPKLYGSSMDGRLVVLDLTAVLSAPVRASPDSASADSSTSSRELPVIPLPAPTVVPIGEPAAIVTGQNGLYALGRSGSFYRFALPTLAPAGRTKPEFDGKAGIAFDGSAVYLVDRTDGLVSLIVAARKGGESGAGDTGGFEASWRTQLPRGVVSGPVAVHGAVVLAFAGGTVLEVDTENGAISGSLETESRIESPPVPAASTMNALPGGSGYLAIPGADGRIFTVGAQNPRKSVADGAGTNGRDGSTASPSKQPFLPDSTTVAAIVSNLGRYVKTGKALSAEDLRFDGTDGFSLVRLDSAFAVFTFVPTQSGRYLIYSPEADFVPSVISVMDEGGSELATNVDDMGFVRRITQALESGKTYYVACGPARDWGTGKSVRLVIGR